MNREDMLEKVARDAIQQLTIEKELLEKDLFDYKQRTAQLERECERLKSYFGKIKSLLVPVLCDPEGYVCMYGGVTDKEDIQKALSILEREA